jgi:hypothetical protein
MDQAALSGIERRIFLGWLLRGRVDRAGGEEEDGMTSGP